MDPTLHGTDEELELYALGRLGESESAVLEEHLLFCAACRERLDSAEVFAFSIREASRMDPLPGEAPTRGWFGDWFGGLFESLRKPAFAAAAAVALLSILAYVFSTNRTHLAPEASLQLTAMRGEMASVPPTSEIDITLTDAPHEGGPFRLEVVDAVGKQLWTGTGIEARIHRPFATGVYFVRLYTADGKLAREYGFAVKK